MLTDTPPPSLPETRIGVVLRVAFFIASALVGLLLLPGLLLKIFGFLVAGTVGLLAAGVGANILTMQIFDRRPLADVGLKLNALSAKNFLLGLALGAAAGAAMLAAPLLAGSAHLSPRNGPALPFSGTAFYLLLLLCGAVGEEMLFRGYAFQLLVEKLGPFATVLPVGVLFGITHSGNPHATELGIANTMFWGILLGFAFLRSRDLWLPIGLHYGWNSVLPLFGVNLSGLTIDVTRYTYKWDLTPLWSGGDYGPEGGLLTTIFVITLFAALIRIPIRPQIAAIAQTLNDPL